MGAHTYGVAYFAGRVSNIMFNPADRWPPPPPVHKVSVGVKNFLVETLRNVAHH